MTATQKVYAEQSVSITELKNNPNAVFAEAGNGAIAVLSHNKPKGYILSEKQFVEMIETMEMLMEGQKIQNNVIAKFRPTNARLKAIADKGEALLLQASKEELGQFSE